MGLNFSDQLVVDIAQLAVICSHHRGPHFPKIKDQKKERGRCSVHCLNFSEIKKRMKTGKTLM